MPCWWTRRARWWARLVTPRSPGESDRSRRHQPGPLRGPSAHVGALDGRTLYASTEPCAMCSAAIYWSGIGRVVFALGSATLLQMVGNSPVNDALAVSSREIFTRGKRAVEVDGPLFEREAAAVHEGFWT